MILGCVLLTTVVGVITTAVFRSNIQEDTHDLHAISNPCPNYSKNITLDTRTTLFSCNDTFLQLRQPGKSVTFTIEEWNYLYENRHDLYRTMGLFVLKEVVFKVGRARRVTIRTEGSKGITLTEHQLIQLFKLWKDG